MRNSSLWFWTFFKLQCNIFEVCTVQSVECLIDQPGVIEFWARSTICNILGSIEVDFYQLFHSQILIKRLTRKKNSHENINIYIINY